MEDVASMETTGFKKSGFPLCVMSIATGGELGRIA